MVETSFPALDPVIAVGKDDKLILEVISTVLSIFKKVKHIRLRFDYPIRFILESLGQVVRQLESLEIRDTVTNVNLVVDSILTSHPDDISIIVSTTELLEFDDFLPYLGDLGRDRFFHLLLDCTDSNFDLSQYKNLQVEKLSIYKIQNTDCSLSVTNQDLYFQTLRQLSLDGLQVDNNVLSALAMATSRSRFPKLSHLNIKKCGAQIQPINLVHLFNFLFFFCCSLYIDVTHC